MLLLDADRLDHGKIFSLHIFPRGIADTFLCRDDHVDGQFQHVFVPSEQLSDPSSDPVSLDGVADFFAGDDRHSGIGQVIGKIDQIKIFSSGKDAFMVKIRKIFLFPNPLARTIAFTH
jgi:hypothetical protein